MNISPGPTVSVIIPAYNVGPYIDETLNSLFAQTYRDFEAIVINDGSTDETEKKLAPFRDRIVYIKQKNAGLAAARNAGLRAARGRFIALLDGDDIWLPKFLETLVNLLEKDSSLTAAFPNAFFFGSPRYGGRLYQEVYPATNPVTFERVLNRDCYIFVAVVFRRIVLEDVGMFDENMPSSAEDFDLWLRMLQSGYRFAFITEPLVKYRWRQNSLSNNGVGMLRSVISVYEKLYTDERRTTGQRRLIEANLADLRPQLNFALFRQYLRDRNYGEATSQLAAATEQHQSLKRRALLAAMYIIPGMIRFWAK